MATSEQIRNRIVELVKTNKFNKSDLLQVFSQLVHEGILANYDIIKIEEYLHNKILQAKTRMELKNNYGGSYNSHQWKKGERFVLGGKEFIVDNF